MNRTEEVDRNLKFFEKKVDGLMKDHAGQFALLRHESIVGFFGTCLDAYRSGVRSFADGLFSIQEVTIEPLVVGFFSFISAEGAFRSEERDSY